MIELRWLTRSPVPYGEAATVLQYRVVEQQIDSVREEYYMGWSAWKDVPTESVQQHQGTDGQFTRATKAWAFKDDTWITVGGEPSHDAAKEPSK